MEIISIKVRGLNRYKTFLIAGHDIPKVFLEIKARIKTAREITRNYYLNMPPNEHDQLQKIT